MNPRSFSSRNPEPVVRIANVLVILALVAMLVGAVLLLLARDHTAMDVPPGERVVVEHDARSWDPWDAELDVRVVGAFNTTSQVTFEALKTTGQGQREFHEWEIPSGASEDWNERLSGGDGYRVTVENVGEDRVRVTVTMSQLGNYWAGGGLVVFGVFGFVFHRMGMSRED